MRPHYYQPFSKDSDLSNYDYIVIGSGLGGLTAAHWLSKVGYKIAILERHYIPGGFTHAFKRTKGFKWDVGVHYVGNMGEGPLKDMFNFLTSHRVKWNSMGEIYDVAHINGDQYFYPAGEEKFRKEMHKRFPEEKEVIDNYLKLVRKSNKMASFFFMEKAFEPLLSKAIGWLPKRLFRKYSGKTTLEVLSGLTDNKKLIAALCAQCGNYGLTPKYSSFAAHALVIGHFMEGGYFPDGGGSALGQEIIRSLSENGVDIFVNADVKEVHVNNKRVHGITVNDSIHNCKRVISNVGAKNTFQKLIKNDFNNYGSELNKYNSSLGHMCLYVGLDASDKELGLPKHNVWSFENEEMDQTYDKMTLEQAAHKFSYISFPSAKDPDWQSKHPKKATIQALTMGKYDWFDGYEKSSWMKRGEKYNQLKEEFKNSMLERLYQLFPKIKGHVVCAEVSTPLSTKHFTNYQSGEIYGLAHTPDRFNISFLRPKTKIKGLWLTGQDITLVGVAGAMLSGMLCAITILKWRTFKVFRMMSAEKNRHQK